MKVQHYRAITPLSVSGIEKTTQGLTVRRLIEEMNGAGDFMLDVFEIEPNGYSELHRHPWDHQVFVVAGTGQVRGGDQPSQFGPGDVIFIPPDEDHQFVNTGSEPVLFVCAIPKATLTAYYLDHGGNR